MEQYIPKSALVAEIKRRIEHNTEWKNACKTIAVIAVNQAIEEDKKILSIIDTLETKEVGVDLGDPKGDKSAKHIIDTKTLEVKEVDLEKYYHDFLQKEWFGKNCVRTISEMMDFTAKHFFELGMAVSNKAQKGE